MREAAQKKARVSARHIEAPEANRTFSGAALAFVR
jgi:hypothetical protein